MKDFFTSDDPVVPVHHPRVLVETAIAHGADRAAILENVGISHEMLTVPEARISYAQFAILEGNALRLTGNPALGLHFGRNIHLSHMGLLGLAVASSPNARAALDLALRYYTVLAPAWHLELLVRGDSAVLTAKETIQREHRVFAVEALIAATQGLAMQVLARRLPVREVRLDYPKPAYFDRYKEFFDMPIRFDASVIEAEFDASVLAEPIASADPATAKMAEQYFAAATSRWETGGGLLGRVRNVLSAAEAGRMELEQVARTLRTSSRTLRRELSEMGTSFQDLRDEALRTRAEEWLRSTDIPLTQIAERLGFSDVRSFRRAFKRWTGRTPADLRRGEED